MKKKQGLSYRSALTGRYLTPENASKRADATSIESDHKRIRVSSERASVIVQSERIRPPSGTYTIKRVNPKYNSLEIQVLKVASKVIGNTKGAEVWFSSPNSALGQKTPRELIKRGEISRVLGLLYSVAGQ